MNKKDKKDHWIIYVRYFSFALSFGVTMILAIPVSYTHLDVYKRQKLVLDESR